MSWLKSLVKRTFSTNPLDLAIPLNIFIPLILVSTLATMYFTLKPKVIYVPIIVEQCLRQGPKIPI